MKVATRWSANEFVFSLPDQSHSVAVINDRRARNGLASNISCEFPQREGADAVMSSSFQDAVKIFNSGRFRQTTQPVKRVDHVYNTLE